MRQAGFPKDPETGLANGASLLYDLALARDARRAIDLLSLSGGDGLEEPFLLSEDPDLPTRVGEALRAAAVPYSGSAYRLADTLYAIVSPAGGPQRGPAQEARDRLDAEAPHLGSRAVGARVVVPDEAPPGRAALRLAFGRLRARSGWQPLSAGRQARDVLVQLMAERRIAVDAVRRRHVVGHAIAVGRALGVAPDEFDALVRAAELQDVGLLTLPDSVLRKSTPLSDQEWDVVRAHPDAGARILAAAPALAPVAGLVRASYERFDGTGYPDGLQGEAIPLGARIIAVCVAFDAMTSARAYRRPRSVLDAMAELEACAGTQFDPDVVAAFREAVVAPALGGPCADRSGVAA